jgi:hypothetical protein
MYSNAFVVTRNDIIPLGDIGVPYFGENGSSYFQNSESNELIVFTREDNENTLVRYNYFSGEIIDQQSNEFYLNGTPISNSPYRTSVLLFHIPDTSRIYLYQLENFELLF